MSTPGGGQDRDELDRLLRDMGPEPLLQELDALGLARVGRRVRCPFPGCQDQGPKRPRNAAVGGGHPRVHCHRCGTRADLLDVLLLSRGWSAEQARDYLRGRPSPPPATKRPQPQLRVVSPTEDPEKLSPSEVRRLWENMAREDELGRGYLEGRHLEEAADLGLVRFCTDKHPDQKLRKWASRMGLRVAVLMSDVVGEPRGIQLRRVNSEEPSKLFAEGSDPRRGFFGHPDRLDAAPVVAVAEGLADTLAVALWAQNDKHTEAVGAAGAANLAGLADELAAAGVPLEGKVFALFVQNDRKAKRLDRPSPMNPSRTQFTRLAQKLQQLGATVVFIPTPEQHKDVAAWRAQEGMGAEWPPEALRKVLLPEPGDDTEREEVAVVPEGHAFPMPAQVRTDLFGQNFTTLEAILDDPVYREPILGRGELEWCQMRHTILFAGRPVMDGDVSSVRLGLEQHSRSTDNKPLQFGKEDIWQALHHLAQRRQVHPAREWLSRLEWDKRDWLSELAPLFGHARDAFQATLLRRWFVGAAARALQPGCKMESVLVLIGPQGWGKTRFFETMGGEFYTSEPINFADKDAKLIMRRAWIVEWGELQSMKRAKDVEQIKDFVSRRVDQFRPHYLRALIDAPRTCVMGGTTNQRDYLWDPTGDRRFSSIELLQPLDIVWLEKARAQLWAQAVALYRTASGCPACVPVLPGERCPEHRWWLDLEEQRQLARVNAPFRELDEWVSALRRYIAKEGPRALTTMDALEKGIQLPVDRWGRAERSRVCHALRALGWSETRRHEGHIGSYWVPPSAAEQLDLEPGSGG